MTPDAVQKQLDEIYKAKKRLYDQRRVYSAKLTVDARWEHLVQELVQAAERLPEMEDLSPGFYAGGESGSSAVLFCSDWHYGMIADNAWNTYNKDVFLKRLRKYTDEAIRYIQRHQPDELHVVLLGDLQNGALHVSSRIESDELACDQLMQVSEYLAKFIHELSSYVPRLKVHSTYGNHGRSVQNKKESIHNDNMERLIPWWLEQRLKGVQNVEVMDSNVHEFIFINVCGWNLVAVHGDLERKANWGQIISAIFAKKFKETIDYVCIGDLHHNSSLDINGVEQMIVGSMCGTDSYANQKRLFSMPSQTMLFFSPDAGKECRYDIVFRD